MLMATGKPGLGTERGCGARALAPPGLLLRVYWRLFKPQFSLDGLRTWAGMPLQEARPQPNLTG